MELLKPNEAKEAGHKAIVLLRISEKLMILLTSPITAPAVRLSFRLTCTFFTPPYKNEYTELLLYFISTLLEPLAPGVMPATIPEQAASTLRLLSASIIL